MGTDLRFPRVIPVSVTEEQHRQIMAEVARTGASKAAVIRRWLAQRPSLIPHPQPSPGER